MDLVQAFLATDVGRGLIEDEEAWFRITDLDGNYLYVSPRVQDFLGYGPDDFASLSGFDMLHPDEIETARTIMAALKDGPVSAIYRMRHKDGHYVWVHTLIQIMQGMIIAIGRPVPERLQGINWSHVDEFL